MCPLIRGKGNTLLVGQTTYLDFALQNNGTGHAESTDYSVYEFDGYNYYELYRGTTTFMLAGSINQQYLDIPFELGVDGDHLIVVSVNEDRTIVESNYSDNDRVKQFTWVYPPDPIVNIQAYTPSGWPAPVQYSQRLEYPYSTYLYANQPSYIDYAVRNTGTVASGSFVCQIRVDGQSVYTETVGGLEPDETHIVGNVPIELDEGTHTLELRTDATGAINESNESDNNYSDPAVEVFAPSATVYGYIQYRTRSALGWSFAPARLVTVGLFDQNPGGTDEFLAEAITDMYGGVSFPTISNVEADGSRRDLYLKVYAANLAASGLRLSSGKSPSIQPMLQTTPSLSKFQSSPVEETEYVIVDGHLEWDALSGEVLFAAGPHSNPAVYLFRFRIPHL